MPKPVLRNFTTSSPRKPRRGSIDNRRNRPVHRTRPKPEQAQRGRSKPKATTHGLRKESKRLRGKHVLSGDKSVMSSATSTASPSSTSGASMSDSTSRVPGTSSSYSSPPPAIPSSTSPDLVKQIGTIRNQQAVFSRELASIRGEIQSAYQHE